MINRNLLKYLKLVKKETLLAILMKYTLFFTNILFILAISNAVKEVFLSSNFSASTILLFLLEIIILVIIRFFVKRFAAVNSFNTAVKVQNKLRDDIYSKLSELGIEYIEKRGTSSLTTLAAEGVEQLEVYFSKYIPQLFYALSVPFLLLLIIGNIEIKAALLMFCMVPLIPLSIVFFMKKAKKTMGMFWNSYENMSEQFLDSIQGLTTLKLFNRDKAKSLELKEKSENFRRKTMKVLSLQLSSIFIMDFFSLIGAALGIIVALISFSNNEISIMQTVFILLLASEFFLPMRLLGALFHAGMNGVAASDNIFKFLNEKSNVKNSSKNKIENFSILNFKNVNFSYDGKREVLKNITFSVNKGEKVAVIGKSGSGKSTLISLLLRFFDVSEGKIELNGGDIKEIELTSLRNLFATVSQKTYLFNDTIKNNLLIAKPEANEDECFDALKMAGFSNFVKSLPEVLEHNVGEWGNLLSGGQKQRIALARAVLKQSDIYLFDEATSNVDADNEEEIWDRIFDISKDQTALIISHRLSVARKCDKIIVLDNGKIKEQGTHNELIGNRSLYYKMHSEQSLLEKGFTK